MPTSRRQSTAQIFTPTKSGPVHTPVSPPVFAAEDFTLTSIRCVGGSIRRVQFSWTPATSRRRALVIIQSQASIPAPISALSLTTLTTAPLSHLREVKVTADHHGRNGCTMLWQWANSPQNIFQDIWSHAEISGIVGSPSSNYLTDWW